jgi:hypothetical protein
LKTAVSASISSAWLQRIEAAGRRQDLGMSGVRDRSRNPKEERISGRIDPSQIMQVGMGFWASKALLSAVELELFTRLGGERMTAAELAEVLGLHERAVPDFPDALVALRVLDREGDGRG